MGRQIRCSPHSSFDSRNEPRREGQVGTRSRDRGFGFLKRRAASTSVSPPVHIFSFAAEINHNSMNLPATISHNEKDETIKTKPLLDCGAGGIFIDQNFA